MESAWIGNSYINHILNFIILNPVHVTWAGDYADEYIPEGDNDLINEYEYVRKHEKNEIKKKPMLSKLPVGFTYIINHTKKKWLDLNDYLVDDYGDPETWIVHPLPLLTADGNGRGGGDYHGINEEDVGSWKGDLIELASTMPEDYEYFYIKFSEE